MGRNICLCMDVYVYVSFEGLYASSQGIRYLGRCKISIIHHGASEENPRGSLWGFRLPKECKGRYSKPGGNNKVPRARQILRFEIFDLILIANHRFP